MSDTIEIDTERNTLRMEFDNYATPLQAVSYPGLRVYYDADGDVCAVEIDNASKLAPQPDWLDTDSVDAIELQIV
jgi:hypothetical protein